MKKLARFSLVLLITPLALIMLSTSVQAVDLQAIEGQVRQQAAERQRVATTSPEVLEVRPASTQQKASVNQKSGKKYQDVEVVHWSILGGAIRLRTWNGQLLLSIF